MATALATRQSVIGMLEGGASVGDIGTFLDALDAESRWDAVNELGLDAQRRLYDLAAEAAPLTLEDFVPSDVEDLVVVRHRGRNTIPIPGLNLFAKVMTRHPSGAIIGYNQSPVGFLVGPGYFTTVLTPDNWADRGAVVVDYYQAPGAGPLPEGWPRVRPNWLGIQFFVYFQMRDFMRRVSTHVTIGAAYKWSGTKMGAFFILCRD